MLNYFINRAGRGLSRKRRAELEKAKALLSRRIERGKKSKKKAHNLRNHCPKGRYLQRSGICSLRSPQEADKESDQAGDVKFRPVRG